MKELNSKNVKSINTLKAGIYYINYQELQDKGEHFMRLASAVLSAVFAGLTSIYFIIQLDKLEFFRVKEHL